MAAGGYGAELTRPGCVDSEPGQALLRQADQAARPAPVPVLLLFDGQVLADPSNTELAAALGVKTRPGAAQYDVAVIGAWRAGLAATVYLIKEITGTANIAVRPNTVVTGGGGTGRLDSLTLQDRASGRLAAAPAAHVPGDQPARGLRHRRRPPRLGETGSVGGRRGFDSDPSRPRLPAGHLSMLNSVAGGMAMVSTPGALAGPGSGARSMTSPGGRPGSFSNGGSGARVRCCATTPSRASTPPTASWSAEAGVDPADRQPGRWAWAGYRSSTSSGWPGPVTTGGPPAPARF